VVSLLLAAPLGIAALLAADDAPLDIGDRLELLVDLSIFADMRGASLRLHHPVPREVAFTFDAPWEGPMSAYATVLRAGEGFRLYYRGGGETTEEVTCMAESRDGIAWTRPTLGLHEFRGSKDNNIVFRGRRKAYWESHNLAPFIDTNPAAPPDARWKALALGRRVLPDGEDVKALVALASPDGIRWRRLREEAAIATGSFDSQNVSFWDAAAGRYVCYLRHGREGKRSVMRATSEDFLHWTEPEWIDLGPGPLEHLYTNAIAPYFREPRWRLGFPMRFVPERKSVGWPPRAVDGVSDALFIASRDGIRFPRTFPEAFIRPGPDPGNWGNAHGNNTPAWGLLETAPGEISIYWCEGYGATPRLRRGTLRTDGFASLCSPAAGGEAVTRPITFKGNSLVLNCSTSAAGAIRVEFQDTSGRPVPGLALGDCSPIFGDDIEREVRWSGSKDLKGLEGRPVRLRFSLADADVFSLRFR
jgi:hypothetical protein